jgi:hypothetical protein
MWAVSRALPDRRFLNIVYKRVEPLYSLLGVVPVGWLRFLFNWYARPFEAVVRG